MSTPAEGLPELLKELPPDAQRLVRDFVEFLVAKHRRRAGRKLGQPWAGALRSYRDRYTALELQRKALEWRSEG